jgi:protein TonB
MKTKQSGFQAIGKCLLLISVISCCGFIYSCKSKSSTWAANTEIKKEADSGVFTIVDVLPSFPGGMQAQTEYLRKNIRYPEEAAKIGKQGRVVLRFIVDMDGKRRDIEVLRSVYPTLDAEAKRVVKDMPDWIPGQQDGKPVAAYVTIPILFILNKAPGK